MFVSSKLLIPLLRNSCKINNLCSNRSQLIRYLSCSALDSSLEGTSLRSNLISGDKGKSDCNSFSGQSIFDQKLIVKGENVPQPWDSIDCYPWPVTIKEYFSRLGITKPTTIQSQSWPIALDKRDLVGISTTGSGKTLAFVLPALVHIESRTEQAKKQYIGPDVVILTPTRELAQQINQVFVEIGLHVPVCLFGGAAKRTQSDSLASRNPTILVSTPGRLNDFIDERKVDLSKVSFCVLDEADRMLELGLEAQIRRIIDRMPKPPYPRQTLLFSATWPAEVRDLACDFLRDFVQINIGSAKLIANPNIEQNFLFPDPEPKAKESAILNLLKSLDDGTKTLPNHKILIFVATKKGADYLQRYLTANGFLSMSIHSDRPQHSRNLIIDAFRTGSRSILIGTDIASRGLDIEDISLVINYDMPHSAEDYVHRIGRTARSEKSGKSYSFFMPEDARLAGDLVNLLREAKQTIDPKLLDYSKLVSKHQMNRDKMGHLRYGPSIKKRLQNKTNLTTNYRRPIYS